MTAENDADEFERLLNGYAEEPGSPSTPAGPRTGRPAPSPESGTKLALYRKALEEEGYRFTVDEDGDISFRCEGKWYVLFVDSDPMYFRLTIPNLFECKGQQQADLALVVANDLNRSYKVAKLVVVDGWVWCNVEMFLIPLDTFRATFERCVELLSEACGDFRQRMKRAPEKTQPAPAPSPHEGFCDDCAAELSALEPTDEPERSH